MKKGKNILDAKIRKFAATAIVGISALMYSVSANAAEASGSMSAKIYQNMSEESVVGNLLFGNQFEVISAETDESGAVWYKVKTDFGVEGYVTEKEMNGLVQTAAAIGRQAASQNQQPQEQQTEPVEGEIQTKENNVENNADDTMTDNNATANEDQNNAGIIGAGVAQAIENIYEITSEETSEIMKKQSMEDQSTEEQSDVNEEQESTQAQIFAQENNTVEETLQSKETDSSEQVSVETEETDQSLSQEVEPQGKTVNVKSGILLPVLLVTGIAACIAGIIYFTGKIKKIK